MAKLAQGLNLNVSAFRIAPRDKANPNVAAVGEDFYLLNPVESALAARVLKEKDSLGGGYKFMTEPAKTRNNLGVQFSTEEEGVNELADESNIITKDEIFRELNLLSGSQLADGKSGSLTKPAITKDLIDFMTKDIEKLKRQGENILTRQQLIVDGEIYEETPEERARIIQLGLEEKGCTVIHAEDERVQAMRHQTGQLGGLGAITMEEVLEMRKITTQRIKELEIEYYKNKDTKFLSPETRKRLKHYDENYDEEREREKRRKEKDKEYLALETKANEIREKK